ncbi:MAG: VOC family protein [Balneolales bacterium]
MQKIKPFLWFDNQAEEAVSFYTSIFKNSKVMATTRYEENGAEVSGQPNGSVMTQSFQLEGQSFIALNGGPFFKFNPSISFFVVCETENEVDKLWEHLSQNGQVLMELGEYDWSKKYGWVSDRYGISWQLAHGKLAEVGQVITPTLMFVNAQHGRAEEAINFYTSVFKNSAVGGIMRYEAGGKDPEGTIAHAQFTLDGDVFMAMDSALDHDFTFNEAISFVIDCDTQSEVDTYWDKLTEGGDEKAQQCGWLKDQFGVSWQVIPRVLGELLNDPDAAKVQKVTKVMLQMKKLDVAGLQQAYGMES